MNFNFYETLAQIKREYQGNVDMKIYEYENEIIPGAIIYKTIDHHVGLCVICKDLIKDTTISLLMEHNKFNLDYIRSKMVREGLIIMDVNTIDDFQSLMYLFSNITKHEDVIMNDVFPGNMINKHA